jgi:hypothetical protein
MNKSLIDSARASGFKVNFLATKIGVKPNYLAMCLRGERNLAEDRCKKLKDFLEAIPA